MLPALFPHLHSENPAHPWRQTAGVTCLLLALIIAWDLTGLDLVTTRWFGSPTGFALRDHWLWSTVLHEGARRLAWALQLLLLVAIWWPFGVLRKLDRSERAMMFVTAMVILAVVSVLKSLNTTSCPWDLAEFGGTARYVSHWNRFVRDGGVGHCFPAGHASAAFCFLPGYLWLREKAPRQARIWLIATLTFAITIGLAQQVRGAHYLSHTLWTGWISWAVTVLIYHGMQLRRSARTVMPRGRS